MSIRRRLLLIVALSGVVLTGAVFSIVRLVQSSDAARIEAAESMVEDVVQAIEKTEDPRAFERSVGAALSGARRVLAGSCGEPLVALRAHGRREGARPSPLPHEHAAVIADACREAKGELHRHRARVRGETLVVAVATDARGRVWASTPLRVRDGGPEPWKIAAGLGALATIILSLVSLDAIVALRRGAGALDRSLDALGEDLQAPIAEPRAEELARIASGLRRLAARLVEAQQRERALSESLAHEQRLAGLGRVAAGVAHEVRNPLAGMKLRLDLLRPDVTAEQREDIDACLSEIERLDRLVRTILGGARRDPRIQEGVAVGPLVDARAPGIAREGDATLATDPDLLGQILDNLVRNAREASDDVRVVVREGEKVEISVVDRGPGVSDEKALFEPFFTTKGEGTGLGLFISRSLAHALRGNLDYRREHDETRFVLTLPQRWSQS